MYSKTKRFSELGLNGKMIYLRENGAYLSKRNFSSFEVHLYQCHDFYVEVWTRLGLGHLCWIELSNAQQVSDNYFGKIDLKKELGL
jgi:hypothetical protein